MKWWLSFDSDSVRYQYPGNISSIIPLHFKADMLQYFEKIVNNYIRSSTDIIMIDLISSYLPTIQCELPPCLPLLLYSFPFIMTCIILNAACQLLYHPLTILPHVSILLRPLACIIDECVRIISITIYNQYR